MTRIQVLGTGCPKCKQLAEHAQAAVEQLNLDCQVEKVTDLNAILSYGVVMTPALVIDDRVVLVGKVASVDQIKQLLRGR